MAKIVTEKAMRDLFGVLAENIVIIPADPALGKRRTARVQMQPAVEHNSALWLDILSAIDRSSFVLQRCRYADSVKFPNYKCIELDMI